MNFDVPIVTKAFQRSQKEQQLFFHVVSLFLFVGNDLVFHVTMVEASRKVNFIYKFNRNPQADSRCSALYCSWQVIYVEVIQTQ